ncbi:MAG: winged helix-turn-helix domain-containing protein, partial [Clostridia bacterium]
MFGIFLPREYNVSSVLSIVDLSLDTVSKIVKRNGNIIDLSSKEFALLEYFMQNKERVLSREQIEQHIWNYDYESGSNVI